jgi:hypothetical protein
MQPFPQAIVFISQERHLLQQLFYSLPIRFLIVLFVVRFNMEELSFEVGNKLEKA